MSVIRPIVERDGPLPDLPGAPFFLRRVYGARGVRGKADLDRGLGGLTPPSGLQDSDKAALRIAQAVRKQERILLVGDFDADGATSVALSISMLESFGAREPDFVVPNRFEFGYGLSPEVVDLAAAKNPKLLITVDNGTSSIAGVARANALGMDVIITDHHLPGAALPPAYAVVNPNVPGCRFPSKALAGVGVIYYVLSRTRAHLREAGWFSELGQPEPVLGDWLDLVALGTVADVVPLDQNNRRLVHQGVLRMRKGRCRPGIMALAEVGGRKLANLKAEDLGFALAPRLNAAGRLQDMGIGIRCLLAPTLDEARPYAQQLDELNLRRRQIEADMLADAELLVARHELGVADRYGLVVYDPSWHQGVVGLIAGRLKERHQRPVVAFADADEGGTELRGSARSLPAVHVRDALDAIATRDPGLLTKFGGHAAAAGLSLRRYGLERFAKAFDEEVRRRIPPGALQGCLETDGILRSEDLTLNNALLLANAGPWGQGFPEPLFHGEFDLVSQRVVGEEHLKLALRSAGRLIAAIAFRQPPLPSCSRVRLAYALDANDYNGLTLQLRVTQMEPLD